MRRLGIIISATVALGLGSGIAPRAQTSPPSPLAEYPGFGHDPEADEAQFNRDEIARENIIAVCMANLGHVYVPEPSIYISDSVTEKEFLKWALADQNQEHVEALSDAQRDLYFLALVGTRDPFDETDPGAGGCAGQAEAAVYGVFDAAIHLRQDFELLEQQIASDPAVVAAEQQWSGCMGTAGHPFSTRTELFASLDQNAAEPGADLDAIEAEYEDALAASLQCEMQVGLPDAITDATNRHEATFVAAHQQFLEEHRNNVGHVNTEVITHR